MKKILLSVAAVAALSLTSCGGSQKQGSDVSDSTSDVVGFVEETVEVTEIDPETIEAPTDAEAPSLLEKIKSAATKENVAKGIAYVKGLISGGKLTEAKSYLDQIKPYADKVGLGSALTSVETTLGKAESLAGSADKAKNAVAEKTEAAKESAKDKIKDKADEITDKTVNGVKKGYDATKKAAEKGADAVKNATEKGVNAVKGVFE